MKIYTKNGDAGMTSTYSGERISKGDSLAEVLGAIDEIQARIGLVAHLENFSNYVLLDTMTVRHMMHSIQRDLIRCSSDLATSTSSSRYTKVCVEQDIVEKLEDWIDEMDLHVPPLTKFILVGSGPENAEIHLCRTATRTAERRLVQCTHSRPIVLKYLNRLSDFFFMLARVQTYASNGEEIVV